MNPTRPSSFATRRIGAAGRGGGARRWCPTLSTHFCDLRGGAETELTAWASTQNGSTPTRVREGFLQEACEAPVELALALRVALADVDSEIWKKTSIPVKSPKYLACVDDITVEADSQVAPDHDGSSHKGRWKSMDWSCGATCAQHIVRCLGDGKVHAAFHAAYPGHSERWADDKHGPTADRLKNATELADRIRQMCDANRECHY